MTFGPKLGQPNCVGDPSDPYGIVKTNSLVFREREGNEMRPMVKVYL